MSPLSSITLYQLPAYGLSHISQTAFFKYIPFLMTICVSTLVVIYPLIYSLNLTSFVSGSISEHFQHKEQLILSTTFQLFGADDDTCRDAFACGAGEAIAAKYPLIVNYVNKLVGDDEKFFNSTNPHVSVLYKCLLNMTTDDRQYKCEARTKYFKNWRKMVNIEENGTKNESSLIKMVKFASLFALNFNNELWFLTTFFLSWFVCSRHSTQSGHCSTNGLDNLIIHSPK